MAMNTRTLILTTIAMSSGMATSTALAGDHGDAFSTCGTNAHAQPRQLAGVGIMPANALEYHLSDDLIEALNQPQREMLMSFERMVQEGGIAPHVCLHPDTNPKVAAAFEQFLNDLWAQSNPNEFILSTRWSSTATNGAGLQQGDPTTLTYSFVPDGTNIVGEGASNLQSTMNSAIGAGTWEDLFGQALNSWTDVSGLNYIHEPNDEDFQISGGGGAAGVLGLRGDVRIAGNFLDGNGGVLAFNYFPNNGDMVLDTGDAAFYANSSGNYRRLRNVVSHEAGHGIGLAHVESDSNGFLMEPFISTAFDGPQIDDIRGAQRGYGDIDESNNSFGSATDFSSAVTFGPTAFVGGDTKTITLRSMDDNSDIDYYTLTTGEPVTLSIFLSPTGGSYQITAQGGGGGGSFFDAESVSDLNVKVADSTTTTLMSVDDTGAGQDEALVVELPTPGQYFIIVDNDNTNSTQTYSLLTFFTTLEVETCPADYNGDGELDFFDISGFLTDFGNQTAQADFNNDGEWDFFDISAFLTEFSAGCP